MALVNFAAIHNCETETIQVSAGFNTVLGLLVFAELPLAGQAAGFTAIRIKTKKAY